MSDNQGSSTAPNIAPMTDVDQYSAIIDKPENNSM